MNIKKVGLFAEIEEICIAEIKRILGKAAKNFIIDRESFSEEVQRSSIFITALTGKVYPVIMGEYQMDINVYFSIISSDISTTKGRRNELYPILEIILRHFSGLTLMLSDGNIKIEPKDEFKPGQNDSRFLEYNCCFCTTVTIEKSEEGDELLGVVAEYYADPSRMPDVEPNLVQVIKNAE